MLTRRSTLIGFALSVSVSLLTTPVRAADDYRPDPAMLEAAKKEGQLLLYTTHIVDQIVRPMIKGFQAHAPGIDVKFVRADGLGLVVRLINEARAGRVQADVWSMVDGAPA